MPAAAENVHELKHRAVRVSKLVDAIDRMFDQVLPGPREVQARSIVICIPEWKEPCWRLLCSEAGIERAPSEKTIELITAVYRSRAEKKE